MTNRKMGMPSQEQLAEMDRKDLEKFKSQYNYDFPMASMTADVVVYDPNLKKFMMIQRKDDGKWAHAGGFVDIEKDERIHQCAVRELKEETNLEVKHEQLMLIGLFDEPKRDYRGRTISACYLYLHVDQQQAVAGDDAKNVAFFSLDELNLMQIDGKIAFDHDYMIQQTLQFLQAAEAYHAMNLPVVES